jgi:hypothetical protein
MSLSPDVEPPEPTADVAADGDQSGSQSLSALKQALRTHLSGGDDLSEVRGALRQWCQEVQAQGEPPQRVLISFKRVLTEAANTAWPRDPTSEDGAGQSSLAKLVTLCIEEYYRK